MCKEKNLKYIFTKTGETVDFGDVIIESTIKKFPFGSIKVEEEVTITEENINEFIRKGVVSVTSACGSDFDVDKKSDIEKVTVVDAIEHIAKGMNISFQKVTDIIDYLNAYHPIGALELLNKALSEILNEIDEEKKEEKEYVYIISKISLLPVKLAKNHTDYEKASAHGVPVYYSKKTAARAWQILKPQIEYVEKQENC